MGSLSTPQETLSELAEKALVSAKQLEVFLDAEGLPQPSFAADGPMYVVPKAAHKATQNARVAVAEAALKLFNLASGPSELLPNITANVRPPRCIPPPGAHTDIGDSTTPCFASSGSYISMCWRTCP
jgi:6-hydroxytryprostatin B O-methyltransferase